MTTLLGVYTGRIAPLGDEGQLSAIVKTPCSGPVVVTPLGLVGDEQADRRFHGGVDKALLWYAAEHYADWQRRFPQVAAAFVPGSFGENLSTLGLTEETVCIGDQYRIGTALVEVCQPRKPCWKLSARFELEQFSLEVEALGHTGWYCRVLQTGVVEAGAAWALEQRPWPEHTLARLWRIYCDKRAAQAEVATLASNAALPQSWRDLLAARLLVAR